MSTRTTRATRASSRQTDAASPAPTSRKSTKTASKSQDDEVKKEMATTSKARASSSTASDKPYCSCKRGDDGTPMIFCTECKDWYHFSCINLNETDAEDISVYVCSSCSEKTGLHSLMSWEESDVVEEVPLKKSGPTSVASKPKSKTPKDPTPTESFSKPVERIPEAAEPSSASEDSDDEYVVEIVKGGRGKHRTRRASYLSDSEASDDVPAPRLRKASSPSLKRIAKRDPGGPPAKKAKTSDSLDDPTRKYCLGKLEGVFRDIFLRYPHVRSKSEEDDGTMEVMGKQAEDLTEEEKKAVLEGSKQFADELEKCVFEIYSEPDKHGKPAAAAKYKDRFRMLQFNLSKIDRVVLHKRIVSGQITPKEISVMSSTDLANEELKQSIKSAEQESLEQSILTKTTAPRTKITHKGLEDIEDISGRDSNRERERRLEEEERMEKERLARLRSAQPRQRTMSLSVPPESPVAPSSESWGGPPPVPAHALDMTMEPVSARPPLFVNTSSEVVAEPEINLADFINIDDEPSSAQNAAGPPQPPSASEESKAHSPVTTLHSPTGISPFAIQTASSPSVNQPASSSPPAQPPTPKVPTPAFDLNALWSLSNTSTSAAAASESPSSAPTESTAKPEDVEMEGEAAAANDQDFDMFLEEKEPELSAEQAQAKFDSLPQVWSGKINMPLDSATPQETPVVGRQMGGKSIAVTSGQWRTLFPSETLRIDGRVPVANSAKFLLQMRMNSSKELVAVAFSPASETGGTSFKVLSEFLINKGRHGLVFPWGNRPKDHHPGKELYMIPLLSSEPLPEYMELLDDLRLPKSRTTNYIVGIWILNKGKLSSPPPQAIPVIPTPTPAATATPVPVPVAPFDPTPAPVSVPTPPPTIPAPPVAAPVPDLTIANLAATLPVDQNTLLAELASLTPEQMAYVKQLLTPQHPAPTAVAPTPAHPPISGSLGPASSSGVQFPMPMPIPPMPIPTSHHWGGQQQPYHPHYDSSSPMGGNEHGFNSRGGGARGGRGRGRGRGGEGFHMNGAVDSGWQRKNSGQRKW